VVHLQKKKGHPRWLTQLWVQTELWDTRFGVRVVGIEEGGRLLYWLRLVLLLSVSNIDTYLCFLDTGGSQLIADGKIKSKNGPLIERFAERGIKFDDGSELEADVVMFATG